MAPNEEPIGRVVDYDDDLEAARVHLDEGELKVGDRVHFKGSETDVEGRVEQLQLPQGPADEAHAGDDVGLPVPEAVEKGAEVLRIASGGGSGGGGSAAGQDPYEAADAGLLDSVFDE